MEIDRKKLLEVAYGMSPDNNVYHVLCNWALKQWTVRNLVPETIWTQVAKDEDFVKARSLHVGFPLGVMFIDFRLADHGLWLVDWSAFELISLFDWTKINFPPEYFLKKSISKPQ